jgi:hypothetical protein
MQEAAQYPAHELEAGQAWILRCMRVEYAKFLMNYLGAWNSCSAALVGVMCMSGAPLLVRKQTKNRTKIESSERESERQKQSVCVCVCVCVKSLGFTASEASCLNKVQCLQ